MALTCQKCRQAVPHESDSWCLGCSAAEALTAELRNTGNPTGQPPTSGACEASEQPSKGDTGTSCGIN